MNKIIEIPIWVNPRGLVTKMLIYIQRKEYE